mmetsp:Transcript_34602/g.35285  ORF Transcript_34602/g.35285 Transcript_34602/m.35285 type:complete len:224 (-) Transcript_34602:56-727(-)
MGCSSSLLSQADAERNIYKLIGEIQKLCKDSADGKPLASWVAERQLKVRLEDIKAIAKCQKEIDFHIYHDYLCAVDDIGMFYPNESARLEIFVGETSYIIRSRCFGLKKNLINKNPLDKSTHIIQREITESQILKNDQDIDLQANNSINNNAIASSYTFNSNNSSPSKKSVSVRTKRLPAATSAKLQHLTSSKSDADYGFYDIFEFRSERTLSPVKQNTENYN